MKLHASKRLVVVAIVCLGAETFAGATLVLRGDLQGGWTFLALAVAFAAFAVWQVVLLKKQN